MSDVANPKPLTASADNNSNSPQEGNNSNFLFRLSSTLSRQASTSGSFISSHLQRKIVEALNSEVRPQVIPSLSTSGQQALLRQQAKTLVPVAADGSVPPVQVASEEPEEAGGECSKTPVTWEKVKAAGALIALSGVLSSLATLQLPLTLQRSIFPLPLFSSALKLLMLLLYQLVVLKKGSGGFELLLLLLPGFKLNYRVTYCSALLATASAYLKGATSHLVPPMLRLSLNSMAPVKVILVEGGWSSDGSLGYNLLGGCFATLALTLAMVREVVAGSGGGASGLLFATLYWALVVCGTVAPVLAGRQAPSGLHHPVGQIVGVLVTLVLSGLLLVVFKVVWPPVLVWIFLATTSLAGVVSDVQAKKACCLLAQHGNLFWVLREVISTILSVVFWMVLSRQLPSPLTLLGLVGLQLALLGLACKPLFQAESATIMRRVHSEAFGATPIA